MAGAAVPHAVRRGALGSPVLRALILAVVLGLLGAAAAAAWQVRESRTHEARAVVLLVPLVGNPFEEAGGNDELVDLQTEAELVRSQVVGEEVVRRTGTDRPVDELLDGVEVTVPVNTQLLEITARADSAADARDAAQGLAVAYLEYRLSVGQSSLFDRTASRSEQVVALESEQQRLQDEVRPVGEPDPFAQESEAVADSLADVRAELSELAAVPVDPGRVVTPAADVESDVPGGPPTVVLLGLLVGALLGLAIAGSTRRLGDGVRTPTDLARADTPTLGALPAPTDGAGHPAAPASLTWLRAAVLSLGTDRPFVIVCVGTDGPADMGGPGTDESAAPGFALATVLAEQTAAARRATVLVDLTGRLDGRLREAPGLVELLTGDHEVDEVVTDVRPHLQTISAGFGPSALDDLTASFEMADVTSRLTDEHDVVVFASDRPSSARTEGLAAAADLVLIAVAPGTTRLDDLDSASAALTRLGAPQVRTVFVPAGFVGAELDTRPLATS
ncbi:MAG: hypothetical protein JWN84_4061 [Nocardioides sp.]|nr:hypothetical protein [Nocardioides sp.]